MATGTIRWELSRLAQQLDRSAANSSEVLEAIRADPSQTMALAGTPPDSWQTKLLRSTSTRVLMLASRQVGKSTVAAAIAANVVMLTGGLVLMLSPSQRQSTELFRKVVELMETLHWPTPPTLESLTRVELANGGRVVSLPGSEATVRGYSGASLIVDEAARVPEELFNAIRPMLAVSQGRMVCLTTPWLKAGWFYEAWTGDADWERYKIEAGECPRISDEFLANERAELPERIYEREYCCKFMDSEGGIFKAEDIRRALSDYSVTPLVLE